MHEYEQAARQKRRYDATERRIAMEERREIIEAVLTLGKRYGLDSYEDWGGQRRLAVRWGVSEATISRDIAAIRAQLDG